MSLRAWISTITLAFIAIIVFFSRHELVAAWKLLEQVNIWILLLLVPGQILVYYAGGEMIFSYLRSKKLIKMMKAPTLARMALEMNFVNHVLPSGGVSGMSYMSWRLGHYGISPGRATMAQLVRHAMGLASFIALLVVAVVIVTIDNGVNRWIILVSSGLVTGVVAVLFGALYLFSSRSRMHIFAGWSTRSINFIVRKLTFGRKAKIVTLAKVEGFFEDMHEDFAVLRKEKKMLVKPFLWGLLYSALDALLFVITFWALGVTVNPAPVLIAYGVAALAGFFVVTPGGAGAYEAIMIAFLAIAGVSSGTAIAGIVLTRVILLLGTIGFGYLFYQHAILKYGKTNTPINR